MPALPLTCVSLKLSSNRNISFKLNNISGNFLHSIRFKIVFSLKKTNKKLNTIPDLRDYAHYKLGRAILRLSRLIQIFKRMKEEAVEKFQTGC